MARTKFDILGDEEPAQLAGLEQILEKRTSDMRDRPS
jgi:hypothetical protein